MALTLAEQEELALLEQEEGIEREQTGFLGAVQQGEQVVEKRLEERGSESFAEAGQAFGEAKGFGKVLAGLNVATMPFERFEAGIANVALDLQDLKGRNPVESFNEGVTGKRLGEIGDVYRKAGVPELASATLGLATTFLPVMKAVGLGVRGLTKLTGLSKFTDKGLKLAGKQLLKGSDDAVKFIGQNLENVYAPINKVGVDGIELINALDDAPKVVIKNIEKQLGRSIETVAETANIADTRAITQAVGKLKPRAFGKGERGVIGTIEDANINKTYSNLKKLVQKTLADNGLEKQAKHIVAADDAFSETINASNFIKKAITESTLKLPTKAGKVAKGIKTGGDLSSRAAVNTLLKGGKEASNSIANSIKHLNAYNRAVTATDIGRKVLNYSILGGVAGSIGARSAGSAFGEGGQ